MPYLPFYVSPLNPAHKETITSYRISYCWFNLQLKGGLLTPFTCTLHAHSVWSIWLLRNINILLLILYFRSDFECLVVRVVVYTKSIMVAWIKSCITTADILLCLWYIVDILVLLYTGWWILLVYISYVCILHLLQDTLH